MRPSDLYLPDDVIDTSHTRVHPPHAFRVHPPHG